MAFFSIDHIKIKGIAAAVPSQIESNWDYDLLTDKEKRLLVKTTGVEEKRRAPNGTTTSDLCFHATKKLMKALKWDTDEIMLLVFVSQSCDYFLPATAIILQDRLGLPKNCIAFDVGLGCSGYVYGLSIISSFMNTTGIKKALLMAGDVSSATCSFEDKSTYPLFGDAGTVTALEIDSKAATSHYSLQSDGSGYETIIIPDGGIRNRASEASFEKKEISKGIKRSNFDLALNGIDVFNFSVTEIPKAIKELLTKLQKTHEDYDFFLMHQANKLMNETIRKKLNFNPNQVPYTLKKFGNTSSASIPLTLISELREEITSKKLNILMTGFGVGLSWGVVSLEIDQIICPEIVEV